MSKLDKEHKKNACCYISLFGWGLDISKITLAASSHPCPWASGRCRRSCLGLCCCGLADRRHGGCPPFRGPPSCVLDRHGHGIRRGYRRESCCRHGRCRCWFPLERIGPVSAAFRLRADDPGFPGGSSLLGWCRTGWDAGWLCQHVVHHRGQPVS